MEFCTYCHHEGNWHGADDPDGQPPSSEWKHRTRCWHAAGACPCPKFTTLAAPGEYDRDEKRWENEPVPEKKKARS